MPSLDIKLDGDNCWPELRELVGTDRLIDVELKAVALLPGGMASGKASVTLRIDLPDGRVVLAQTSADLFCAAARAFVGRQEFLREQAERSKGSA